MSRCVPVAAKGVTTGFERMNGSFVEVLAEGAFSFADVDVVATVEAAVVQGVAKTGFLGEFVHLWV